MAVNEQLNFDVDLNVNKVNVDNSSLKKLNDEISDAFKNNAGSHDAITDMAEKIKEIGQLSGTMSMDNFNASMLKAVHSVSTLYNQYEQTAVLIDKLQRSLDPKVAENYAKSAEDMNKSFAKVDSTQKNIVTISEKLNGLSRLRNKQTGELPKSYYATQKKLEDEKKKLESEQKDAKKKEHTAKYWGELWGMQKTAPTELNKQLKVEQDTFNKLTVAVYQYIQAMQTMNKVNQKNTPKQGATAQPDANKPVVSSGKDFDDASNKFTQSNRQLYYAVRMMGLFKRSLDNAANRLKAFAKTLLSTFKKFVPSLRTSNRGILSHALNWKKALNAILKYAFGVRSLYFLFRKLRAAVAQGFKNLVQFSDEVNQQVSAITTNLTLMKNASAAALQPLLNVLVPAIQVVTNAFVSAANAVGLFFAAITGQGYIYKATAAQEDYAASLDKTGKSAGAANKQLAKFDDLDVLNKNSGGGSGSGSPDPSEMFEKIDIENNNPFKHFVDTVKDTWGSDNDFEWFGAKFANIINDWLNDVDFTEIDKQAKKIATSIGTAINGFVETLHWNKLGRTISNGIEVALNFADTLLTTIDFGTLGTAIGNLLNGAVAEFPFSTLGKTIAHLVQSGIDFVYGLADTFNWTSLGLGISKSINKFFENVDWKKLGSAIAKVGNGIMKLIITAIQSVNWGKIGKLVGDAVGQAVKDFDWSSLSTAFSSITKALSDFIDGINASEFGDIAIAIESIAVGLGTIIAVAEVGSVLMDIALAMGQLKIALEAMGIVLSLTGIGEALLVIAGAVAAVGVIAGMATYSAELGEAIQNRKDIEDFGESVSDLANDFDSVAKNCRDAKEKTQDYMKEAGSEVGVVSGLADEYFALSEKQDKTVQDYEKLRILKEKLVESNPEFQKILTDENLSYDQQKQSIQQIIEQLKLKYQVEAAGDAYKKVLQEQYEASYDLVKATQASNAAHKELEETQARLSKLQKEQWEYMEKNPGVTIDNDEKMRNFADTIGETSVRVTHLTNGMKEINAKSAEAQAAYDALGEHAQFLLDEMVKSTDALKKSSEGMGESVDLGLSGMEKSLVSRGKEIKADFVEVGENGQIGLKEGWEKELQSTMNSFKTGSQDVVDTVKEDVFDEHSPSKVFSEIGKYAVLGLAEGFSDSSATETVLTNATNLGKQIVDAVNASFTYDTWTTAFSEGILLAETEMLTTFTTTWQTTMQDWWANSVLPYFGYDVWLKVGTDMKNGIFQGMKDIVSQVSGLLNKIIGLFNEAFKQLENAMNELIDKFNESADELGVSRLARMTYTPMPGIKVPALAKGAVIPPNKEFLAVLGDQKSGTNIEAPLDTIVDAFRQVVGDGLSNGGRNATMELDGQTFARLVVPYVLDELNRSGYNVSVLEGI